MFDPHRPYQKSAKFPLIRLPLLTGHPSICAQKAGVLRPFCAQVFLALLLFAGVASAQIIAPAQSHTGALAQDSDATPPATAPAQHAVKTAPQFNRKAFIAEVSLLGAAKTADAITTRQVLDRGGWEGNPIFGRHPSPAKQSLINLGIFAAQSTALYFTERNHRSWVRWAGRAFLAHTVVEHAQLAACNAGIDMRSPRVQDCKPFMPF